MKLGGVLKKEREREGPSQRAAADGLGITLDEYTTLEAGQNKAAESTAHLIPRFKEPICGQVGQPYYPCGLPFTEVRDYEVRA